MKLPLHVLRERAPLEIQMTPMIDVVFLLLVFFVWTAGFQLAEKVLPSRVSTESAERKQSPGTSPEETPPPPEADFDRIIVRVGWREGQPIWSINQEPMPTVVAVREQLRRIGQVTMDVPVILHPDGEVPLSHVIDVYDAARQVGFTKVSLAARQNP
jgi:biopolymer transport protein ExbD